MITRTLAAALAALAWLASTASSAACWALARIAEIRLPAGRSVGLRAASGALTLVLIVPAALAAGSGPAAARPRAAPAAIAVIAAQSWSGPPVPPLPARQYVRARHRMIVRHRRRVRKQARQAAALAAAQAAATTQAAPPTAPASTSPPAQATAPAGSFQSYAASLLPSYGWPSSEFGCLDALWNRESGWNPVAANASGAYGIPQALPGSKMASAGADWATNGDTQIRWGLGYIKSLYGSPCGAWGHSQATGWY